MKQATHFIEQVKYPDGYVKHLSIAPIHLLQWSFNVNKNHSIETIAIFKIYPKNAGC